VSYNGGNGGITARPTPQEEAAAHAQHVGPVAAQVQHQQAARSNTQLRASVNHGKPPVAATAKPGEFSGNGVVAAKSGSYNPPARAANTVNANADAARGNGGNANTATPSNASRTTAIHPKDLPPAEKPAAPDTGNAKLDQKYQQQQQQLANKQQQQLQSLQKKQDQDHQRLAQQKANDAAQQQTEQRHQQQTQQLVQRQSQQQQQMQQRQQPAQRAPQPQPQAQPPAQPRPEQQPGGEGGGRR
jgi:hypothetical protein